MLSRWGILERTLQAGVSSIAWVIFQSILEGKPLCKHCLQKELLDYVTVFQTWIHRVMKGEYVVLRPWMHKTHQSSLQCASIMKAHRSSKVHSQWFHCERHRSARYLTVLLSWMHVDLERWLHYASIMSAVPIEWYMHVFQSWTHMDLYNWTLWI